MMSTTKVKLAMGDFLERKILEKGEIKFVTIAVARLYLCLYLYFSPVFEAKMGG